MTRSDLYVRPTRPQDFPSIEAMSRAIYPRDEPWLPKHLRMHLDVFPEGQFVAVDRASETVVGMAASLILAWDDYDRLDDYNELTDRGFFTNHDPEGRTLYGAEVMVAPEHRRRGVGSLLYARRRRFVQEQGLLRIRAGARLPGYHRHADEMDAATYVARVVQGTLHDPTLSFQLRHGFDVLAVVPDYLHHDPRSHGYAALIEWLNPDAPPPQHAIRRDPRFQRPPPSPA